MIKAEKDQASPPLAEGNSRGSGSTFSGFNTIFDRNLCEEEV